MTLLQKQGTENRERNHLKPRSPILLRMFLQNFLTGMYPAIDWELLRRLSFIRRGIAAKITGISEEWIV
jgi:hypothetical protein